MNHTRRLLTAMASGVVLALCMATPAAAEPVDPHGGTEPGTHPSVEVKDPLGGAGSGPIVRDPGTLEIHETAPATENLDVYPDTEDRTPGVFRTQLGGMTDAEREGYAHAAGQAAGDSSAGGDKTAPDETSVRNTRAGKRDAGKSVVINVLHPGDVDSYDQVRLDNPRDLEQLAKIEPLTSKAADGQSHAFAYLISFTSMLTSPPTDVMKAIFRLTGGLFGSCLANGNAYVCTFATPKTIHTSRAELTVPTDADLSSRQIPICAGVVKDGGYGSTTVISVADVDCEAAPGKEPVRLEVSTIFSDLSLGIPTAREGDGAVVYSATPEAEGTYVSAEVWAVAADGTYSMPFPVVVRNRYSPAPQPDATATPVEAIRGVDTVVPASRLFSDVYVDLHQAESGDHLTSVVTEQGTMGGAWFDAVGDLHYQSIDVIRGDASDHVTVRTTDAFGLPSPEVRLSIHVSDIVPGCAAGGATTDTTTPVRIELRCWITPVTGWRQIDGLHYSITQQPEFGSVTDLDPVSGVATYTPDPGHPGAESVGFSATNNGATREARFAVNVLAAP